MNALIRMIWDTNLKSVSSPLEAMPELLQTDMFATDFANAFAVFDSDESEGPSTEVADIESHGPDPSEPDLDISPHSVNESVETSDLPVSVTRPDSTDQTPTVIKPDIKMLQSATGEQVIEVPKDKANNYSHAINSSTTGRPADAVNVSARPEPSTVSFDSDRDKSALPVKTEIFPVADKVVAKDRQIFSDAVLTTPSEKQPALKTSPIASDDPVPSMPMRDAKPVLPATTIATPFVVPVSPATISATAQIQPSVGLSVAELDMENDGKWVVELSRDIGQLTTSKSSLRFQLKPQNLGQLRVEIIVDSGGDMVRLETDNETAKALIVGSQGRLEQDIRLAGIKLARVDVEVQSNGSADPGHQDSSTQRGRSEPRQDQDRRPDHFAQQQRNFEQEGIAASSDDAARYA